MCTVSMRAESKRAINTWHSRLVKLHSATSPSRVATMSAKGTYVSVVPASSSTGHMCLCRLMSPAEDAKGATDANISPCLSKKRHVM